MPINALLLAISVAELDLDAGVPGLRQDLVHLVLDLQFELFDPLLFEFVSLGDVRLGLNFVQLTLESGVLLGEASKLLVGREQVRLQ